MGLPLVKGSGINETPDHFQYSMNFIILDLLINSNF